MVDAVIGAQADALLIAGDLFDRAARYPAIDAAAPALMRCSRPIYPYTAWTGTTMSA
jgi:DNA repair exonuclease SbcCD nuclease subunit